MTKKIAVLISNKGTGTNLQAIINSINKKEIDCRICVVVSNSPKAFGLNRASRNNIPTEVFGWAKYKKLGKTREDYSKDLAVLLGKYKPDLVILAGWLLVLTKEFFEFCPNVLNIHPGLIPDKLGSKVYFPDGSLAPSNEELHTDKAIQTFLDSGGKFAGSTIHFVTPRVDWGPVVARGFEKIKKGDSVETLYSRLKVKEHEMLIEAISNFCNDRLAVEGSVVKVLQ